LATVRVIARAEAREGKADELRSLMRQMLKPTRSEQGCRFYEMFESNVPGVFFMNELWESQSDLEAHTKSKHFTEAFGKMKDLLKGTPEIHLLTEVN
jgi:quinol monooxygenase YgiN